MVAPLPSLIFRIFQPQDPAEKKVSIAMIDFVSSKRSKANTETVVRMTTAMPLHSIFCNGSNGDCAVIYASDVGDS